MLTESHLFAENSCGGERSTKVLGCIFLSGLRSEVEDVERKSTREFTLEIVNRVGISKETHTVPKLAGESHAGLSSI